MKFEFGFGCNKKSCFGGFFYWQYTFMKIRVPHVDNDCVNTLETSNLFLVNLLPSINKIVIRIIIKTNNFFIVVVCIRTSNLDQCETILNRYPQSQQSPIM